MSSLFCKRSTLGLCIFFISISCCQAQAIWELGARAGSVFYLGDENITIFNKVPQPALAVFARWNANPRWTTKIQFASASISSPFDQQFQEVSFQEEFNFFEYGLLNGDSWTNRFSPYICGGIALTSFDNRRGEAAFSLAVPFGFGIKYKIFKRINVGMEWTMHKLFTDNFDYVANPRQLKPSRTANNDWYSMCMLSIGIDLGDRSRFCK
ncbi:MAG: DUF6089 family protein [Prevotellaceae bacterium]|jgi:hypothetical protein|nr:DUF6089 family protein [Prevotellaceae bacterium]